MAMSAKYCCTALPRSDTPEQRATREIELVASVDGLLAGSSNADSRYTSTRTEDLREIQQLFNEVSLIENGVPPFENHDCSSPSSSRHSGIAALLRKKLSRQKSKSKGALATDQNQIQRAKSDLRHTLLSYHGPEAGGYDADAPMLEDVEASVTLQESEESATRGRGRLRSQDVQGMHSNAPRYSRVSNSASRPRMSTDSRRLRRSYSDSSLYGPPCAPGLHPLRLPSFSASTSSRHWKRSVMESLQISSPSTPILAPRRDSSEQSQYSNWPLRDEKARDTAARGASSAHTQPLEHASRTSNMNASFDRHFSFGPYSNKPSTDNARPVFGPLRDHSAIGHRGHRSSAASVHLYNMRISHHLRSLSSFSNTPITTAVTTAAPTAAPTRAQTPVQRTMSRTSTVPLPEKLIRRQRQDSSSGFATEDVPETWGEVIKPHDAASSTYSTAQNSPDQTPRASRISLPRPSITSQSEHHPENQEISDVSDENMPLAADSTRSSSSSGTKTIARVTMPDNPSVGNLSQGSKSSKISRFREDFGTNESRKSTKRNSIVNLFIRSRAKRCSDSVSTFDGSMDEPRRLQRAMALTDRQDATGLLAKAIKAHQDEKSCMYLSTNKDNGPRDLFRQRSSSFCKPRTLSIGGEQVALEGPVSSIPTIPAHHRSTSDSLLKPEFSITGIVASHASPIPSQKRASSTGRLKPEFSIPLFSAPACLMPGESSPPKARGRHSVTALDPMESTPFDDAEAGRTPSFQLNDVPATVNTQSPIPSVIWSPSATLTSNESAVTDLDNPNLDLGAWSRYPSHTREKRTGSAGATDKVKTRDFAYDINPMNIIADSSAEDDSPRGKSNKKKGKGKKKSRTGLPKSKSMLVGKDFIRNYARLIRSPSIEWLMHGKGHRSSISAGGSLEHPELEVLPPAFASPPILEDKEEDIGLASIRPYKNAIELHDLKRKRGHHGPSIAIPSSRFDGSNDAEVAPIQKRRAASSPDLSRQEAEAALAADALTWSRHYESCVCLPSRTSHSTDLERYTKQSSDTTAMRSTGSDIPLLIDMMLASRETSTETGTPEMQSFSGSASNSFPRRTKTDHSKNKSVASVSSIRASSMDLLKTLAEAEERERMRCLELLNKARSSIDATSPVISDGVSKTVNEGMPKSQVMVEAN